MRKEQHHKGWNENKTNDSWAIFKIMGEFVNGFEKMSQIGPCVSIFGSARTKPDHKYYKLAVSVAKSICNAGYGVMGSIEEVSDEEVRRQFEVNVFGVLTTIRAVLPQMRKQRSGHIIHVTSIAGRIGSQGLGIYNGSKFALEGIGEALAAELKPLNIKVTNVEPGPFRTAWAGGSASYENTKISDYESTGGERIKSLQNLSGNQPGDPVKAADAIYKLAQLEEAPVHLPLGKIAYDVFGKVNNGLIDELAKFESLGKECDFN